jgi:hypothetical protein
MCKVKTIDTFWLKMAGNDWSAAKWYAACVCRSLRNCARNLWQSTWRLRRLPRHRHTRTCGNDCCGICN